MIGQATVTEADACVAAPLRLSATAVLSTFPQVASVVGETRWTDLLWACARSPNEQSSVPLWIAQPASLAAASIENASPPFVGSWSVIRTPLAVPSPEFATLSLNPSCWPALTDAASAVFVSATLGRSTTIEALSLLFSVAPSASLSAAALAVLSSRPQFAGAVGPVTWTVRDASGARSPKEQLRTPEAIEQSALSSLQLMPAGSGSLTVTLWARPAPMLETTIVKAAVSPALIVPASAVLTILMSGQSTLIEALSELSSSESVDSLSAAALAVLASSPQFAGAVGPVMCTVRDACDARSPKEQLRTPEAIEQSALSSLQLMPAGSGSLTVTLWATPAPMLETTIVKAAVSPALIVPASAVLTILMSGQSTLIEALSELS